MVAQLWIGKVLIIVKLSSLQSPGVPCLARKGGMEKRNEKVFMS